MDAGQPAHPDRVSKETLWQAKPVAPRASIDNRKLGRIRQLSADGWSLRKTAEDAGVSHESVRKELTAATLAVEA